MRLLEPVTLGAATARNRLLFGPIVTNLGDGRALSARHVAFYRRRAEGGCGTIVVEEASVHESDWPYERAPLAERCGPGWAEVAAACHHEGALVLAGLGHAGGQGSSAYSQRPLWAPSRVPEVNSREVPKWMEPDDIAAVVSGFGSAAKLAIEAGCDGVELNIGQHSLLRQFLSGLTNHRTDAWGADRSLLAREVLETVRAAIGPQRLLAVRWCADELAPWAGLTPDAAVELAATLVEDVDLLTVVRGSIFSVEKTRPDFHEPPGFNLDVTRAMRAALPAQMAVVLQGSIIDVEMAERAIGDGVADVVEMTRAQLSDPDLAHKAANRGSIRPCILCNQQCQVRDARNPIISCVAEPTAGHEIDDPDWYQLASLPRDVIVVGGGPAGLECARVAARRGHRVRLIERARDLGGVAARRGPGAPLVAWLEAECRRLGVTIETEVAVEPADLDGADTVVLATGSRPGRRDYDVVDGAVVLDVLDGSEAHGHVAIWDPVGGPIAVALAEALGDRAVLITPDAVAGNELARTGDLAPANVRLQQRRVRIERRSLLRVVRPGEVEIEHRYSGQRTTIPADAVVDCGHRLPDDALDEATGHRFLRAGDAVAPRTIYEAVLEGRRAALAVD